MAPEPPPRPPEALFCSPEPQLTIFMPRVGVGVALGAQARFLVTYLNPPGGTLLYTVFTKKCQKRCKKAVPPFYDGKIDGVTYLGCVSARRALEGCFVAPIRPPDGHQKRLLGVYSRVDPLAR